MPYRRTTCLILIATLAAAFAVTLSAEAKQKPKRKKKSKPAAAASEVTATAPEKIRVPEGFQVELLHSVPKETNGSWVNLCVDPKGRLITSDQHGDLYRIALQPPGATPAVTIERIDAKIGEAQGLLWAFDSLYAVVNSSDQATNGLYRVRDTNNDDRLDSVEKLRSLGGDGEHGPHAVVLSPDGKSLHVVCGNRVDPVEGAASRVPRIWDEDQLLPRIYGVGFMRGTPAPAGAIYKVDPDGKNWERIASGFRNPYDIAFNADGELFTFDADMEWDVNAPWYRPTRVCHVTSGSEWGWRNGSAKWPVYFADTLPPVVNIGPGSPTGITFGYGAKFPAKYQRALYVCDWTYGKMYALHLAEQGASYGGVLEEFMTATPLPLTDAIINANDGAMYFLIGGRKTQSGLYRLTYSGKESTQPVPPSAEKSDLRVLRRELEALHVGGASDTNSPPQNSADEAIEKAWPQLGHADRFIRFAARTAIEHQPLEKWQQRALDETDPQASLTAIMALARNIPRSYRPTGPDLDTPPPVYPADDAERHPLEPSALAALARLDWAQLTMDQQLELLRVYELVLYRMGTPDEATRADLIARFDGVYPARDRRLNVLLTELMCYLQAPTAAAKGTRVLLDAPTQEEQIDIARSLQHLRAGWTTDLHRDVFQWLYRAQGFKGGNNFPLFTEELRANFLANTSEADKTALKDLIEAKLTTEPATAANQNRPIVKQWKMEELAPLMETKLNGRDFDRGRKMFAAANCFACHHFAGEGGSVGPDLTGLAGRFSPRDILESVLEPNKAISDQYAQHVFITNDGEVVVGRITNLGNNDLIVNTNMLDPNATIAVNRNNIESMEPSDVSMMPTGLLDSLHEDEVLDLMAFLLSRGDPNAPYFAKEKGNGGDSSAGN